MNHGFRNQFRRRKKCLKNKTLEEIMKKDKCVIVLEKIDKDDIEPINQSLRFRSLLWKFVWLWNGFYGKTARKITDKDKQTHFLIIEFRFAGIWSTLFVFISINFLFLCFSFLLYFFFIFFLGKKRWVIALDVSNRRCKQIAVDTFSTIPSQLIG